MIWSRSLTNAQRESFLSLLIPESANTDWTADPVPCLSRSVEQPVSTLQFQKCIWEPLFSYAQARQQSRVEFSRTVCKRTQDGGTKTEF